MKAGLVCPACGADVAAWRNPFPTVDVVIELAGRGDPPPIVLIQRKNPPLGWALPGGFVDYGETVEAAAAREMAEETGLAVELLGVLGVYSDPARDRRQHNLSVVFVGRAQGESQPGDDAAGLAVCDPAEPPGPLCFDHARILEHYRAWRRGERHLAPVQPTPAQGE
ncbi:MAG: NUDIX domain-containing protein [Thermodesulfobacteriota bacterium]